MKPLTASACLIALIASVPVTARETPPPGGEPREFTIPPKQTLTLDNGLRATLIPFGATPKVTVSVVVRTGNLDEGEDTWLADLTGRLMKEGTTSRSAEQIALEAAAMGGAVSVSVGANQTSISADVLSEFGADMLRLLAEVVRQPLLPAGELDRIKQDLLRELSVARSRPQGLAAAAFAALLYGDHPYGRMFPTDEQMLAYGLDDARAHHERNFGAARTVLYVAGRFDGAAIEAAIRGAFGDWRRGPDPIVDFPERPAGREVQFIDRPGAPQSTIYLGLRVPDPSDPVYVALSVTNTLLGGYFSSRVTANIREDKGYAYSPHSDITNYGGTSHWTQVADVTTADTGAAIEEILSEIERLREQPPEVSELARVKNYRTGTFILGNASRAGLIGQMAFIDLHGLDESFLNHYVERVHALTPEQVSEVAERYLDEERMTLVVVGDLSVVGEQLEAVPGLAQSAP